ncbi:MAG: recombinase family protein [bacterium]|nr:recombinase family protein [bacterium]
MKAIILARVSDKKQDSNQAQIDRVSDYIARRELTPWKTYEIEESSTKGDREKFQLVVKEIQRSKEPIALVVDTVDRLQRSFKESVQLDELRKLGKIELHFYRENLVIHKNSNSADLIRWDMGVMFARSYVLQLSDNVKRKQEQMRRNGEWTGKPPIGYKSTHDSEGKRLDIIFDPGKSNLVKKMFVMYATGNCSIISVRREIAKQGLESSVNKPLAPSMVEHILKNPFYYGEMCSNDKLYPHKYQPLITRDLFLRCQQIRKSWNKKPFQAVAKPYIFRGLIRCAKCGCILSPETAKGKFIYYSCTNARKEICNKKFYIPERDLLKPVLKALKKLEKISQEKIGEIVAGLKESSASKVQYHTAAIKELQKEYNEIQVKIDRMMDLLIDGSIAKDEYEKKLKEMKSRQQDINIRLEDHTQADENYYLTANIVLNLAKNAVKLFESSEVSQKRAILNYLLQNPTTRQKTLSFQLRSPFDVISDLRYSSQLRDQGSNLGHPPYIDPKIS